MLKRIGTIAFLLLSFGLCKANQLNFETSDTTSKLKEDSNRIQVSCFEKEKKVDGKQDPIITTTCYLKKFKIVSIGYPDNAGRYSYYEYKIFMKVKGKFVKVNNSRLFNTYQDELVSLINQKIKADFEEFSTDSNTRDCFRKNDTIRTFKMNDFGISFNGNEIWFNVNFGLNAGWPCLNVSGTIVSFKIEEIEKYLN